MFFNDQLRRSPYFHRRWRARQFSVSVSWVTCNGYKHVKWNKHIEIKFWRWLHTIPIDGGSGKPNIPSAKEYSEYDRKLRGGWRFSWEQWLVWRTHHYHVVALSRISLTLSRHSSLSFITSGRSSGLHLVFSQNCCMYVRTGRPAFARPYVGIHRSTSLMSSSLLL